MFKIESYVTPILLSYVDKYVRDFNPADAQVSLWGGGVALHNLVLKADVLQREVALPFTLVSGRIHELLIQVPWTKIMSEPIVVTIDTIECVLSLNPPPSSDTSMPPAAPSRKTQVVEAPPGYMQALVRRIVSNIALRLHHLIVKYVQDDIVMSLNVKHLAVDSAGPNWEPAFADIDQNHPTIRRLVHLDDLTLCLDKSDADGKIRFFQEPLLYRCQLDLRVLTRLISANTRRATNLNVQLRSVKLAWSVSNEQLVLLLRLIKERPVINKPTPPPKQSKQSASQLQMSTATSNSAEPTRSGSWTEWAWSWLPTWMDRELGVEEAPIPATPLPISFNAYLDDVSLVFKVMETEGTRKRSRAVLEISATFAALKTSICNPTFLRVRFGARILEVKSHGKCVCGYLNYNSARFEPTVFLHKIFKADSDQGDQWTWPEEDLNEKVETGEAVDESYPLASTTQSDRDSDGDASQSAATKMPSTSTQKDKPESDEVEELWTKLEPLLFVEFLHERSAPNPMANPYENPPKDFEYSDWVEECSISITVQPLEVRVCMGLVHRVVALMSIYKDQEPKETVPAKRVLTVEEIESLSENLPQYRVNLEAHGVRVSILPWNHNLTERPTPPDVVLMVELPNTSGVVVGPMYPHRVCSAACQVLKDSGPLWQGARRHVTVTTNAVQVFLTNDKRTATRPCARVDLKFVTHHLLYKTYFTKRESIEFSYQMKMKELSICGSSARLQAVYHVVLSLINQRRSVMLNHTTLSRDAVHDEDAVAIDITLEDFALRGYVTNNVNMHVVSIQSAKVTALHEPKAGEVKQAWLFSAPDLPSSTPYLRLACQWCTVPIENSFDYFGMFSEPLAMSIDPLLISWLAYTPTVKSEASITSVIKSMPQLSQTSLRRRSTPPSSSGRGGSRGTFGQGAELVHHRSRSHGSSSELSEKKDPLPIIVPVQQQQSEAWWSGEKLLLMYKRMCSMLINVETGLAVVYVTMSTASAIDCDTLRDAMERHAAGKHRVLAISLGRLSMHSTNATKQVWQSLRQDGPTFVQEKPKAESFPWKINLADVSCYTLELNSSPGDVLGQEKLGASAGLKSKLRVNNNATPKTVLELVTTTVTVSVVSKSVQYKSVARKETKKPLGVDLIDKRMQYFSSGLQFKPTTLREFVRGPSTRKKKSDTSMTGEQPAEVFIPEVITITDGPIVSMGMHIHADTPPLIIRLEHDQVHIVAAAIHCFKHIHTLLIRPQITIPKSAFSSNGGSQKSLIRSVSELEEIPSASEDTSENQSELISIFDRSHQNERPMKTFFWFQWVVGRMTLVVASEVVKLALDVDDIISTIDVQVEYKQLKIKLASASIKYYKQRGTEEWTAGMLDGRVLEAREPDNAEEDAHFLSVTITQARVANLPASWKEELHPKLLEKNNTVDSMWEVFATLAPLEALVQPDIVENVTCLFREMAPRAFCPLKSVELEQRETEWQLPFFYLNAGGIRLLVTGGHKSRDKGLDDTIIFSVGKIDVNPHPENPICRRAVNAGPDGGWLAASGGFEGRQYEVKVKEVSIQSTTFKEITLIEAGGADYKKGTAGENPALKWSQRVSMPKMVPILHTVELSCVLAPSLFMGSVLLCGPAVELNLVSDCTVEVSVAQIVLFKRLAREFQKAVRTGYGLSSTVLLKPAFDKHGVCPYATLIISEIDFSTLADTTVFETTTDNNLDNIDIGRMTSDSGVETVASSSKTKTSDDVPIKKSLSVAFVDTTSPTQFLEVFVTMGVIDLSLYVLDDGSLEVELLRPPTIDLLQAEPPENSQEQVRELRDLLNPVESASITERVRDADIGRTLLTLPTANTQASGFPGNVPLLHFTLYQPNVYYWKRKTQKTLQLSLFNAWIALGYGDVPGAWHAVLMATAKGVSDPVTEIPPALATFKVVAPIGTTVSTTSPSMRGTVRLDIERPVQFDLSTDKLKRMRGIYMLLKRHMSPPDPLLQPTETPFLYKLKNELINEGMESITIQTSQISVCGYEGIVGWDSSSLQISASARPERLNARVLITALLVATGPPGDRRHVLLQPLIMGVELEASWEAWRRAEGGLSAREPTLKIELELDDITLDLRPSELATFDRLKKAYKKVYRKRPQPPVPTNSEETMYRQRLQFEPHHSFHSPEGCLSPEFEESDLADHFYKDDLRSGAFKILSGGQLPMAYQVMLHGTSVSWRYPHPRAITRIVAFPLPGQNKEIDCVLELYNSMLGRWQAHTYFKIPVGEPKELHLNVNPPETVFAIMWRFRACSEAEPSAPPYEFVMNKFAPRSDPWIVDEHQHPQNVQSENQEVSAEQLSGVLRVDSYFAPRLLPRTEMAVRVARLHVHAHNSLPFLTSHGTFLEGYYVSKPLMRTHRVLSVTASNISTYAHMGSPAGTLLVVDTQISGDIIDCATGTMEEVVEKFRVQGGISANNDLLNSARCRMITTGIHVAIQVPRLKTLQALYTDWNIAYDQYIMKSSSYFNMETPADKRPRNKYEIAAATAVALEGRVSLWIHNTCASAMRVGQEDTDEVVPLAPGARLAYRWRNPVAPKNLRFALAGPTTDWHWSSSISFLAGTTRLRIETPDSPDSPDKHLFAAGAYVHVKVEEMGASRYMHLSGRLVLANMLRTTLLYKVRSHNMETTQWRTVCSGELSAETVGRSVVCNTDCEMVLKIRFRSHNTCWSGDIPMKECPKENVPWLVKVPTEGESQFVSVWCRVVRGRTDGRILATLWPLYVLHSHLPLDTDVLIVTEATSTTSEDATPSQLRLPPMLQTTPGRGSSTHLQAPGTTAARHNLSFQYRNIECPVTREAVPLHYGVTDTSVFDKRSPVMNIDDVIKDIKQWLERSARNAVSPWPYSVVAKHWEGEWQAASLQPRCDVTVRYQAIRAGGGCSLEIQLCPIALLCNATPISLTLRSYDAAPLCKLEPGTAISPPSAIIKKPFYMSVEMGRETFVSCQLQVSPEEPGRYGTPAPGHVALDLATNFAILCNQKVALLTLYYEIKEDINILGVSSTYLIINRLESNILVSAIAVPNDMDEFTILRPKTFKVVPPTKEGSTYGTSLCRFWLRGRWRGGDPSELRTYLCLSLASSSYPTREPAPIRLGQQPLRRALALVNVDQTSVPIVVTQIKHDNRWLVVVAHDPCPQFLVHNHTHHTMAVAQPIISPDEPSTSHTKAVVECAGTRWWCMVFPNTAIHYSTPAHCARYPPEAMPAAAMTTSYLTFAKGSDMQMEWCSPVVVADGEHLLQYFGGFTIKLRVRTHPHSTLLELQDVDHNDISASDIRRRLLGAFETHAQVMAQKQSMSVDLDRIGADSKLLQADEQSLDHEVSLDFLREDQGSNLSDDAVKSTDYEEHNKFKEPIERNKDADCNAASECPASDSKGRVLQNSSGFYTSETSFAVKQINPEPRELGESMADCERFRIVISGIEVELSAASDAMPLLALNLDRTVLRVQADNKKTKTTLTIADAQIDNLQYDTGQYDFAVVASTRTEPLEADPWPPLWNMFAEKATFATRVASARLLLKMQHDKWEVVNHSYSELTEVEISLGTLALYVEDAYVKALVDMSRLLVPASSNSDTSILNEERSMQKPLRLRLLHVRPLDLTLTLHTAVRMYIALDQSPLRLSAFKLHDMMTSAERLTHALTVHYLSAAILGAGWVVGGLELLGAPGALAARLGGASGGVRGVASAAAAALVRSLSAWAGSLARNLDLLAGDEDHARRAAAARRRPPRSFGAGLIAGVTNFAINMLGAVGGIAHHPLVGVAVGESESSAMALRRGIIGALTKPLSATADLVAYAGSGLLRQTGWDPVPKPRRLRSAMEARTQAGWHRDCVRWMFRLCELTALSGFEVLLDNAPLQLLLTHKFLLVADPETERIVEMIDLRFCTLGSYQGQIIELCVMQRRQPKLLESRATDEDEEFQISAAAMARVARYTGAEGSSQPEERVLSLLPAPGRSHALHAALAAALHHNADSHFPML